MSLTVLRVMLLSLARDRGALALSFLLPVAFFLVFAAIFGGASGDAPRIDIAIADEGRTEETGRLVRALARESALSLLDGSGRRATGTTPALTGDQVRTLVKSGRADVGLIVRAGAGSMTSLWQGGEAKNPPPLTLVEDSAKGVAAQIVLGLIQKAYFGAMPDVMARDGVKMFSDEVGGLTPEQRRKWEEALADIKADAEDADQERESATSLDELVAVETVTGRSAGQNQIAYYAGAVAVMFLLFATAHGAAVLLEEKDAGILDRVLAGPGGMGPLLGGKFLFLVLSGVVQVSCIFAVAWLIRGVDLPGHLVGYGIVTVAAAAAAAGLMLALTTLCSTRRQAASVSTIGILILSAVGGSMVPRFFMPPLLRSLGWLTPNTWALEAYAKVFWRDEPLPALAGPVALLLAVALGGLLLARRLARRWETL